jgi:hypothetical protein
MHAPFTPTYPHSTGMHCEFEVFKASAKPKPSEVTWPTTVSELVLSILAFFATGFFSPGTFAAGTFAAGAFAADYFAAGTFAHGISNAASLRIALTTS